MKQYFMDVSVLEAKKAFKKNEVPVGAVIVCNDKIISKAFNKRHSMSNVFAHAEVLAILGAQRKQKNWRLYNCDLYVTLKPCNMCLQIIKEARLRNIYYLVDKREEKNSYSQTKIAKFNAFDLELEKKYGIMLSDFFKNKRL